MPRRSRAKLAESALLTGIKQGAAMVAPKAFGAGNGGGARRKKRQQRKKRRGAATAIVPISAMNATTPHHLPLPRAVGEYTVIRTSQVVNFTADTVVAGHVPVLAILGPTMREHTESSGAIHSYTRWCNTLGFVWDDLAAGMNVATAKCGEVVFDQMNTSAGSWTQCSLTPAAYSVQVMNPNALQSTAGMIYIGRMRTMPHLRNDTRTVQTFANEFVAYNSPRICSAGKLALRGVNVDAIPMNMAELADFTQLEQRNAAKDINYDFEKPYQEGFAPIVVYNPNAIALQLLVTCEWRVRFDPSNPAQSSHRLHPPASERTWASVLKAMTDTGNGVIDIVEQVAQLGGLARRAGRLAIGPPEPLIVD